MMCCISLRSQAVHNYSLPLDRLGSRRLNDQVEELTTSECPSRDSRQLSTFLR